MQPINNQYLNNGSFGDVNKIFDESANELNWKISQCFDQYIGFLNTTIPQLFQEIRGKSPEEANALLEVYQKIITFGKNASLGGLVEFNMQIEQMRIAMMSDHFFFIDKAIDARRRLLEEQTQLNNLVRRQFLEEQIQLNKQLVMNCINN